MEVKIYDNGGKSFDRYTAVFPDGDALGIGPTGNVPNGFCMHIDASEIEVGPHLGTVVPFDTLPKPVQKAIRAEWHSFEEGDTDAYVPNR
jgi:hypothetical protein